MSTAILLALVVLSLCVVAAGVKAVVGPGMVDRLTAANAAANILTFILALAGVYGGSDLYFDAALVAALLAFSTTLILAKFLGRRKVL